MAPAGKALARGSPPLPERRGALTVPEGAAAAIDCGTNSTRLLVAGASGETIERRMTITRLGEGVDRTGRLSAAAIERTLAALRDYRNLMDATGVTRSLATATSAVRDASNASSFLEPAAQVLGSPPRVLPGESEGRLSYLGATASLQPESGPYLVVDIGGGSTELVTERQPESVAEVEISHSGKAIDVASLDVGCVRLTERFLSSDPPTDPEREAAAEFVVELLDRVDARGRFGRAPSMIGLAGTVSALAVLNLGLETYDRDAVHHSVLRLIDVKGLIAEMGVRNLAARKQMRGMEVERADVLIGGSVVLAAVMEYMGHESLVVSESDILDGVVAELLGGIGVGGSVGA